MKKKTSSILITLACLGLVGACSEAVSEEETKEEPKTEQVDKEAEEKKAEEEKAEKEAQANREQERLEEGHLQILQESLDGIGEVKYDKESKTYTILPTTDEFLNDMTKLVNGQGQESWDGMVQSFKDTSSTLTDTLGSGYSIMVVNPANENNGLLLVSDGKVLYNEFTP